MHCSIRLRARWCAAVIAVGSACGCTAGSLPALSQHIEARRLASDLRVQFGKAVEASNRAVMADTDEASSAGARDAEQAKQAAQNDLDALQPMLQALGYRD